MALDSEIVAEAEGKDEGTIFPLVILALIFPVEAKGMFVEIAEEYLEPFDIS